MSIGMMTLQIIIFLLGATEDTEFAESELEPNTEYLYRVASVKDGKEDRASGPSTIRTEAFETVPVSKNEYSSLVASRHRKKEC